METILSILGFVLIWAAIDVAKISDKNFKFFNYKRLLIILLISVGVYLIS